MIPNETWYGFPRIRGGPLYADPRFGRIARTATLADLRVDETVHAAGTTIPIHGHDSLYLALVLDGEMEERRDGRTTVWRSGCLVVRPPGVVHELGFPRRCRHLSVEVGGDWLGRVGARALGARLVASEWTDRRAELALRIYRAFTSLDRPDNGPPAIALQGYLQALLAEMLESAGSGSEPRWLADARRWLDDHRGERLELDRLAARVGVHRVHLSRAFRRVHGTTITAYLRGRRVDGAAHRLSTSDDPIRLIALATGFADQSHLTRAFEQIYGVSPAAFRAHLRERPGRSQ